MVSGVMGLVLQVALATGAGLAAPSPAVSPVASSALPAASAPASAPPPGRAAAAPAAPPAVRSPHLREPAPRPTAEVRVQNRFATKARLWQVYGGVDYFSRGDFFISPGARVGATYYALESLGLELQVSHFWSSLDDEAQRVRQTLGAIPDSRAPTWLALAGARYSIGYGKLMVGGVDGVVHFEPQVFAHGGLHDHDGDVGPSADLGLGLLFFLTPRVFARADVAVVYERETRSGQAVGVLGLLPALSVGGTL
jgi:outer membrane beta-barrel protein